MTERQEFLIRMYDQMFNDINRHIIVIWQSVGVLVGAFAIFALVEQGTVPIDIATSIILLLSSWLIAHLFDASYWYNRNLIIIANIERQFLLETDLKDIHYYFGTHRKNNKMIEHLRIQMALAIALATIVLVFHFFDRVVPGLSAPIVNIDPVRAIPYALAIASFIFLRKLKRKTAEKYEEFLEQSPGIYVDTGGTTYGPGHGQ